MRNEEDLQEDAIVAGIIDDADKFFAITWERVRSDWLKDEAIDQLINAIQSGFPSEKKEMPETIQNY